MDIDIYEVIGYTGSVIIALSMTMNSFVKFRWINLVGASTFAIYGLLIGAIPVTILNGFIVGVDIYYLLKIYSKKEIFETLEIRGDNKYLLRFLEFHHHDILNFSPDFNYEPNSNTISFFVLRNMNVAGIFLAQTKDNKTLNVSLDYSIPEFRDYKNGRFIYQSLKKEFIEGGFQQIVAKGKTTKHIKYLKRFGFVEVKPDIYKKSLLD